jgi:cytochrome c peroxidase
LGLNLLRTGALAALSAAALMVSGEAFAAGSDDALFADAKRIFGPRRWDSGSPAASGPKVELGRRLFFETRVSADGNVSCAHCHLPDRHGADGLAKSVGVFGKENARNAPTVFNAAMQFKQHWRGDRESLADQAQKALLGPASFGNSDYVTPIAKLQAIPGYRELFGKAFPGNDNPVNEKRWGEAISAYEWTLLTRSRFDAFLEGDANALSNAEKTGLRKFIDTGCANCHDGAAVGGASFQKFGVVQDYWKSTGVVEPDKGRYDVTKNEADLYVFKVPSLLNVADTAPYFHDGSVSDLPRAVRIMAEVQLGGDLADEDVEELVVFLRSLSGPVPSNFSPLPPFPE